MSLQFLGLLIVTIAFAALVFRVYAPRNKDYFDAMSRIPLDDESDAVSNNPGKE